MDCESVQQLIYLIDWLDKTDAISNDVAVSLGLDLWTYGLEQDCQFAQEAFGLSDDAADTEVNPDR